MALDYPWYGVVDTDFLEQGDFFFSCPVLDPKVSVTAETGSTLDVQAVIREYDVLILSQSCDLQQSKLETVLVCPHWPLETFAKGNTHFQTPRGKEDIRRGNAPGYHMLAACDLPGFPNSIRVVSFRQIFSLPFQYVTELARQRTTRLRLLPPYREHLAQAFARFIMRVGLPVDITSFK